MKGLDRAVRREIEKKTRKLVQRVDTIEGRCELMKLSEKYGTPVFAKGIDEEGATFAMCAYPDCVRYGTRDDDEFCQFEYYGSDGQHVFGFGGSGFDLDAEVFQ